MAGVLTALSSLVHTYDVKTSSSNTGSSRSAQSPRDPSNGNAGDEAKALSAAIVGLSLLSEGDGDSLATLLSGGMIERLINILKTSKPARSRDE